MTTHILLIEDDWALRQEIVEFLRRRQNSVAECGTIAAARQALTERRPDIVLADIRLPDGDGVTFCLEHAGRHPGTKWLLMSGDTDLLRQSRELRRGPDAPPYSVLDKPVPLRALDDFVRLATMRG
jgi:DNA-binding NtrC family response regulator